MKVCKNDIVVVVPIYTMNLSFYDKISLNRAEKILAEYQLVAIAPRKLKGKLESVGLKVEYFDDHYFEDIQGYNELMLSTELYKRFSQYCYMLIYQLDAYVFSDKLLEFANSGYDYIGAPVPEFTWVNVTNKVGNGGFSLRKIEAFLELLSDFDSLWKDFEYRKGLPEDQFYAYCGSREDTNFCVPTVDFAIRFALDMDVNDAFNKLGENLPFGCHGWSRLESIWRWKPYIPELMGSLLDETLGYEQLKTRYAFLKLMYEFEQKLINGTLQETVYNIIGGKSCSLWGYGKIGKVVESYFDKIGVTVNVIIDSNEEIKCKYPNKKILLPRELIDYDEKGMIVVSSTRFSGDIKEIMEQLGMKADKDYIMWTDVVEKAIR